MMFLMVLLLMDGDDPKSQRIRQERLRQHRMRRERNRNWDSLGYLDDNGNHIGPLNPEVYASRNLEDEEIRQAALRDPRSRHFELVRKNEGRDIEKELKHHINLKLKEEAERMAADDDGGEEADAGQGGSGGPSDKKQKAKDGESGGQRAATVAEERMVAMDELVAYHFPRNATGYYRGLWVSTPANATADKGAADTEAEKLLRDEADHRTPRNDLTAEDVQPWAQAELARRGMGAGVLFLPPDAAFEIDPLDAENSTPWSSVRGLTQPQSQTPPAPKPSLSLTKDAGRVAFQLYSRPIPAMAEVSAVDGLVKLYDGMTASFVSRRTDVLLRVQGVMIHGVGRMSLVTPSSKTAGGSQRSFLGVRQFPSLEPSQFNDDDLVEGPMDLGRRRRLEEAIKKVVLVAARKPGNDPSSSADFDELMAQIRQDVMDLHHSHYNNDSHGYTNEEDFRNSMERKGWTLIYGDGDGDDQSKPVGGGSMGRKLDAEGSFESPPADGDNPGEPGGRPSPSAYAETSDDIAAHFISSNWDKDGRMGEANASNTLHHEVSNSTADLALRRSTLTLSSSQEPLGVDPTQYVFPYPYVTDDAEGRVRAAQSPVRSLPGREVALEANAANCEFEINVDIQMTRWTVAEWRAAMEHRMRLEGIFNPFWAIDQTGGDLVKLKRSHYLLVVKSQLDFLEEKTPTEALVMTMTGDVESHNCDFHSYVNVTAMRTNWEHTTAKAINYSFYMMLTCLTQIIILLRQLLHTQSQSVASNVSLLCIGWQTVLDAILCISHIFLCLVMQPLFTAFASVAFFKLLIFCVIEMKYMAIIIQARNNANNVTLTQEDLRRQVTLLHLKFYGALMAAILAFWYFGQSNRTIYVLLLYSFWVPQIILNIITESRKPMHPYYVYGMSLTRVVAPVYMFAIRNNFLKEVNPDFPTEPQMCQLLVLWVGIQTAILFAQSKYGTRFMIPQRFLPPKFDYSRPIPPSLLPRPPSTSSTNGTSSEVELGPLLNGDASPSRERSNGVTRNRRGGSNRTRLDSRAEDTGRMSEVTSDTPTLDCVICYNEIDVNDRKNYMLAPCDHIFHRHCLEQWMDVKVGGICLG
ncbi:hypothetical protein ACHAWF_015322 [Thalassiosira exigua]